MLAKRIVPALLAIAALAGCGDGESAADPASRLTPEQATEPLRSAPDELRALRRQANALIEGGAEEFNARLQELRGIPLVVNAWASWCGPCRHEFPFFQSQAIEREGEIAFIGVNVADDEAAAETFLSELPLPYPSYADPGRGVADAEIASALDVGPGLPNTLLIDRTGEVVYHWRGGYSSEADLAAQIDEYLVE